VWRLLPPLADPDDPRQFWAAMSLGSCYTNIESEVVTEEGLAGQQGTPVGRACRWPALAAENWRNYFCGKGRYNDFATLVFNPLDVTIKHLFHQGVSPSRRHCPPLAEPGAQRGVAGKSAHQLGYKRSLLLPHGHHLLLDLWHHHSQR
jgi:hypothetical protein